MEYECANIFGITAILILVFFIIDTITKNRKIAEQLNKQNIKGVDKKDHTKNQEDSKDDENNRKKRPIDQDDKEKKYAKILNLKGRISPKDIKDIYRYLISKNHPDKVRHLDPEIQKIAEQRTREIIEAYNYFKTKYNIT